jgi:hypothetical protein
MGPAIFAALLGGLSCWGIFDIIWDNQFALFLISLVGALSSGFLTLFCLYSGKQNKRVGRINGGGFSSYD